MKNIYKFIWTDEAIAGLKEIILYLEDNFAEKEVKKFAEIFEKYLNLIQTNPKTFSFYEKSKNIRRAVIAKLTSIYYIFDKETITIISVFNNRKEPRKF